MTNPITHCAVCATHWTDADVFCDGTCATCLRRDISRLELKVEEARQERDAAQAVAGQLRTMLLWSAGERPWIAEEEGTDG